MIFWDVGTGREKGLSANCANLHELKETAALFYGVTQRNTERKREKKEVNELHELKRTAALCGGLHGGGW